MKILRKHIWGIITSTLAIIFVLLLCVYIGNGCNSIFDIAGLCAPAGMSMIILSPILFAFLFVGLLYIVQWLFKKFK